MPDITMCRGYSCTARLNCYRHVATPGPWQSFFAQDPRNPDGTCDDYWGSPKFEPKKTVTEAQEKPRAKRKKKRAE